VVLGARGRRAHGARDGEARHRDHDPRAQPEQRPDQLRSCPLRRRPGVAAVIYAPHFKLRAFDSLSDEAKHQCLVGLLEALVAVNFAWLREHPNAPWLYESGVRYEEEPPGRDDWQDIPETIALRVGDCEDLGCWRIAELRARAFENAQPHIKRS